MVVEPIGSATAGVRVAPVPILRKAGRSASASINPFSPDGAPANPLADMVTLSLEATRLSSETAVPSRLFNSLYFMYPNASIREFAFEVVGIQKTDSNDVKMGKIARWVQRHILYREDLANYGYEEFWAPPAFTLRKGSGDCEDGAFLIVSLALNAGVPEHRLRMYGGQVHVGVGAATGGHGWVGYRRESDHEWIPVDFSYYPNPNIDTIVPMSEDERYIDDYFFMTVSEFVVTPGSNRVRDPDGYTAMGQIRNQIWIGNFVNRFA